MVVATGIYGRVGHVFRGEKAMGSLCVANRDGMPVDYICASNPHIRLYHWLDILYIGIYEKCVSMEKVKHI